MVETSDQIERHIQRKREELSENVNELQVRVKTVFDWRAQVEEHPGTMLAVAFGGGMLLSALLPSGRLSKRPSEGGWPAATNGNGKRSTSWEVLTGALVGIATARLTQFVEELIPGFQQELDKARQQQLASNYPD